MEEAHQLLVTGVACLEVGHPLQEVFQPGQTDGEDPPFLWSDAGKGMGDAAGDVGERLRRRPTGPPGGE
jgi:hypothetical protein